MTWLYAYRRGRGVGVRGPRAGGAAVGGSVAVGWLTGWSPTTGVVGDRFPRVPGPRPVWRGVGVGCVRRCPTLPHPGGCSTIGAERLSFRVRNGTGRFPFAMTTDTSLCVSPAPHKGRGRCWFRHRIVDANTKSVTCCGTGLYGVQALGLLVTVSCAPHGVSTPVLSTPWSVGGLTTLRCESPHLEACFPLRCFQRLSLPNVANQPCPWQDNWHTRGWSVPVLSY